MQSRIDDPETWLQAWTLEKSMREAIAQQILPTQEEASFDSVKAHVVRSEFIVGDMQLPPEMDPGLVKIASVFRLEPLTADVQERMAAQRQEYNRECHAAKGELEALRPEVATLERKHEIARAYLKLLNALLGRGRDESNDGKPCSNLKEQET